MKIVVLLHFQNRSYSLKKNIMTGPQQADQTMFASVDYVLTNEAAVYEDDVKLKAEVEAFKAAYAHNLATGAAAHPDNSGFSQEKLTAKIELGDFAAMLAGESYVTLKNMGKISIAEKFSVYPTNYTSLADSACGTLAQTNYNLISDNADDLIPDTITNAMLAALLTKKNTFTELQGTSEAEHEVSPQLTEDFKNSFGPVKEKIENLKFRARKYETINYGFWERFMASTDIPTVHVRHTYLEIVAINKATSAPIEGIVFTLTKGNKSATTDYIGKAVIAKIRSGEDVLTGVLGDKTVYTGHIVIERSKINSLKLVITIT